MSRKEELESSHPTPPSPAAANKYARWRTAVEELLVSRWLRAPRDVRELAATVVGMFDAGARDAEVAALLSEEERSQAGAPWHSDAARLELVRELHRSAGFGAPDAASDEDL
jgi:hypothetical protein